VRVAFTLLGAAAIAAGVANSAIGQDATPAPANPCLGPDAAELLCPNLRMHAPADLKITRTASGRTLLHATNSIDSRGEGPAELRGKRYGRHYMTADQRVRLASGGRRTLRTPALLGFKHVPGKGVYWKFKDAAVFELWTLDEHDKPVAKLRTGPKQYYCLRDLFRTAPKMAGSPPQRVYPACNEDKNTTAITLGTSIGWSDVYPTTYPEQYIDVTGVKKGRYGYIQIADPKNGIWENNENDNASMTIVSLPSGKPLGTRTGMPRP
jgi:hypothetical protein